MLGRTYGYTADHVTAIDIVTADGQFRHATADTEQDLFWALFAAAAPNAIGRAATFGYGPPTRRSSLPPLFDPATAARLVQVRSQFDPEEMFLSVVDANICS